MGKSAVTEERSHTHLEQATHGARRTPTLRYKRSRLHLGQATHGSSRIPSRRYK